MLKSREAARLLENIVGPDNFSEDPAIIASYVFQPFPRSVGQASKDIYEAVKLGAVILPGNTEEVQTIAKVCNRYGITYKALSTGLGAWGVPTREGSLQVDMRRMNRIIKLEDRNMYAIVEPYVTCRELAVESSKKGLTCHIIGAGSETSVLASVSNGWGHGHDATTASHNGRNCLGAEWVLPTGEVVRWGLVEEGKAGYPGPGLPGIYRGNTGAFGGLGIFTKVAVKLYPWPGPAALEIRGENQNPGYKVPHNMRVYLLAFPSPEKLAEAVYKLTEEEIAYHAWCHPLFMHPQRWMGSSNDDHYEIWERLRSAGLVDKSLDELSVVIAGYSERELRYKEKVLKEIIGETGATDFLAGVLTEEDKERFFCAQIAAHKPCTEFRIGAGDMGSGMGQIMHWSAQAKLKKWVREFQKKYIERGILIDTAGESCWGGPIEQRAAGHTEYPIFTDTRNLDCMAGRREFLEETHRKAIEEKLMGNGSIEASVIALIDELENAALGDYFDFKRKIKDVFDPKGVADAYQYLAGKQEALRNRKSQQAKTYERE